jgi:hypothetical protein
MKKYLKDRLIALRKQYRDTGSAEYLYRMRETQRVLEHLIVDETYTELTSDYKAENGGN